MNDENEHEIEQTDPVAEIPPDQPKGRKVLTPEQRAAKNEADRQRRAAKKAASPQTAAEAPPEGEETMATVKKARKAKAKKEPKVAAPKKARATRKASGNGHAAGPRGEKTLEVRRLLLRKNGCTAKEVLEATGWPAVSMPLMAKNCHLKLRQEKEKVGDERARTRYFGSE